MTQYVLCGLQVSLDNAVALTHTCATPFLVDPTGQASAWITKREQACSGSSSNSSSVEVASPRSPGFVNAFELAVRFGKVRTVTASELLGPRSVQSVRCHDDDFARDGTETVTGRDATCLRGAYCPFACDVLQVYRVLSVVLWRADCNASVGAGSNH